MTLGVFGFQLELQRSVTDKLVEFAGGLGHFSGDLRPVQGSRTFLEFGEKLFEPWAKRHLCVYIHNTYLLVGLQYKAPMTHVIATFAT